MQSLLQGIQTAFNANSAATYGLFANGCEVALAEDAEALPLCVLTVLPPPAPSFENAGTASHYLEIITVYFSIYSTDPSFVQSMEANLDSVFNRQQIDIAPDYNPMTLKAGGGNPYRDEDGRTWRADYYYRFWVERFA